MVSRQVLPETFGRYQVLEELGKGAMGVVYLCVDPVLARPVAIKVMRESEHMTPAEREQYRARFRNEVEAAGRLNHPGIVQIYDLGPSYLVMEFLEGKPLAAALEDRTAFDVQTVCSMVLRVADALDYAHRHGIVHRDIKPANIMIIDGGGVKVMDFGVARLESSTLTAAGAVLGSVRYMAPEQMMGERVDGRADVFSLGAVAYEALTAQAPFPGKSITEVVSKVVHGAYVPPRQVDQRLPASVDAVFGRVFAVRASERYPRGMDFARDLYGALQDVLELEVRRSAAPKAPVATTTVGDARAAAAPPAEEPVREAVLLLDSDPSGARVDVDGKPSGVTPVPVDTAFGRHVVRMEAAGREPVSAEIDVRKDRPLRAVSFTLPPQSTGPHEVRAGEFVAFGPGVSAPRRISGAVPAYPLAARERGMEGSPSVDVWIDEKGNVIDVAIVESAGAMLDSAVLEAVATWRFEPARLRGVPVSMRLTLQHLFRR